MSLTSCRVMLLVVFAVCAKKDNLDVVIIDPIDSLAMLLFARGPAIRSHLLPQKGYLAPHRRIANSKIVMEVSDAELKNVGANNYDTPFDRFLRKIQGDETQATSKDVYIDPQDVSNYITHELEKPMGLTLEEFTVQDKKFLMKSFDESTFPVMVAVTGVTDGGSASKLTADPIRRGYQLVGVDSNNMRDKKFSEVMDLIGSSGATVKLTFFKGPQKYMFGPTAPADEWIANLLEERTK
mmetsp:Transcript_3706/g.5716  ORF Transcript_3706/g.5716 Transcript_3706/m.5716 type:complete len:239 (+) Transcript_3706:73-789(+)